MGGPAGAAENNTLTRSWSEEFGGLLGLRILELVRQNIIKHKVHLKGIPFLGLSLGMQPLATKGFEGGEAERPERGIGRGATAGADPVQKDTFRRRFLLSIFAKEVG